MSSGSGEDHYSLFIQTGWQHVLLVQTSLPQSATILFLQGLSLHLLEYFRAFPVEEQCRVCS